MKSKSFLFLSFICLFTAINSKVDFKDIELVGELDPDGSRSVGLPAVIAEQTDNAIILRFTKAIGEIEIAINADDDAVYSIPLNVTGATQYSIYIGNLEPGTYSLEIVRAISKSGIYGDFIIE